MKIDWHPPQPREGFKGYWDKFVGPGATRAELVIALAPALKAGAFAVVYAVLAGLDWSVILYIPAFVFAVDIVGGVLTNATAAAKRWYHRPGQGLKQHFKFVMLHIIHFFVFTLVFRTGNWTFFAFFAVYLTISSLLILTSPWYLERPVALLLYMIALTANFYLFTQTPGMEWFVPFFFLKLLVSHSIKETVYAPGDSRESSD